MNKIYFMYYIVKWVLILFVSNGDCEIRGITNYQLAFTSKVKCDSFVLTLNTNKPQTLYGDYADSIKVELLNTVPNSLTNIRVDTLCN